MLTFSTFGLFALQKIQIKTLKGDVFKIDGEPTDTVMDLKTKIEAAHGAEMAADRLRLILEGKVLKDTQTVAEINVTEQSFIVCMVSKDTKVGFLVFSIYFALPYIVVLTSPLSPHSPSPHPQPPQLPPQRPLLLPRRPPQHRL